MRNRIWHRKETDSKTASGKWITRERRATTGKVAAKELVVQMMKREATRRLLKEASPPPEPQLGEDMLMGRARGATRAITVVIIRQGCQRNCEGPHDESRPGTFQTRLCCSHGCSYSVNSNISYNPETQQIHRNQGFFDVEQSQTCLNSATVFE